MKVLVLAPYLYDTSPGQRFRIEQWMPLLEREGVEFHFDAFLTEALQKVLHQRGQPLAKAVAILRGYAARLVRLLDARSFDVVFLHRETAVMGPALIERLLVRAGVPFVYDFDDAVFVPYVSPYNDYLSYLKFPQKTATSCRLASHVIAGNEFLRDYAARHNSRVTIVPTTIDTDKYAARCRYPADQGEVVIGWSGSHTSARYLPMMKPIFERLAEKRRFRVDIIGINDFQLDCAPVRTQLWQRDTEVQDLSRIQIGVMPLPEDPWAKGKCALKALQYMALGIPTVVSPVGTNADVIQHGVNGFHADGVEAWTDVLARLIDDESLRRRIGLAGLETVQSIYSARAQAPRVLDVLRSAAR